ncbi:putative short-chain dehydrogenase [Mytilinidion resinicola]|uniref:Short-chain dehydrogenase n=1 Tax=Mytilinidion resinicola TaxID=574789 RepID=A0A6A6YBD1_9PEZI|nr:putative short-chain dehydrogenase [Mytilinidion resinicola]KAF2805813.1 putative short-chain dehydrogenase [Mytilinidion resinicola]
MSFFSFVHSQLFVTPIYPSGSYTGRTVIITGSNTGLGKEAARHFTRLGASTVILGVRSVDKGNAAKADIEQSTKCAASVVQVWQLDVASYASVRSFAARVAGLERVDIFLANAGIAPANFALVEGTESMITVNVIATFLLTFLVLPKMRETAKTYDTKPTLSITTSEVHAKTAFQEKAAPDGKIFEALNDEGKFDAMDRYPVSKLLEVFGVRAFAGEHKAEELGVTVNCLNPGLCHSELMREAGLGLRIMKSLLGRTTEAGSRTLVHAASQGPETHGKYLGDCKIKPPGGIVLKPEGKIAQERVWTELVGRLEAIVPGVTKSL